MKFATKLIQHYPSHLKHVATLPSNRAGKMVGEGHFCKVKLNSKK